MKKRYKLSILVILILFIISACSKDKSHNEEQNRKALTGDWIASDVQGSIIEKASGENKINDYAGAGKNAVLDIKSDGNYTITSADGIDNSSSYSVSGNQLSLNNYFSNYPFKGNFTVSNSSLHVTQSADEFVKMWLAIIKVNDPDTDATEASLKATYTISDITYTFQKQ